MDPLKYNIMGPRHPTYCSYNASPPAGKHLPASYCKSHNGSLFCKALLTAAGCGNTFSIYRLPHSFCNSCISCSLSFRFYVQALLFQVDFRLLQGRHRVLYLFLSLAFTTFGDSQHQLRARHGLLSVWYYPRFPEKENEALGRKQLAPDLLARLRISTQVPLIPKPTIFLLSYTASHCG